MVTSHLIDVRTPEEFATGFLGGAVNIEYQSIHQLAQRPGVSKSDDITLYCRSGRRSAIAMDTLKSMGFERVRDIGSLEEARETISRESAPQSTTNAAGPTITSEKASKETLESSTKALLDGLKALE
ncbi:uncharacterized protein K452DRAFT_296498 [Aplosporella prunicola CBS 121167]|uniref:Rhodanese domain-containing protein n=1 Tax=Aplosporella prunicola CBS 121167 TaxID=1176127 RepID=A0A6A6BJH4_9PEZI|nr:uncharacterized protein K452DRAFT_296498 [Aplosporella prunicola CBS 121167]KAF2144299.1 hypothetical protein K452DRAFT_296498 [Aplosporella prunicola CBS 121167]